jgi:hypothetical protein
MAEYLAQKPAPYHEFVAAASAYAAFRLHF